MLPDCPAPKLSGRFRLKTLEGYSPEKIRHFCSQGSQRFVVEEENLPRRGTASVLLGRSLMPRMPGLCTLTGPGSINTCKRTSLLSVQKQNIIPTSLSSLKPGSSHESSASNYCFLPSGMFWETVEIRFQLSVLATFVQAGWRAILFGGTHISVT